LPAVALLSSSLPSLSQHHHNTTLSLGSITHSLPLRILLPHTLLILPLAENSLLLILNKGAESATTCLCDILEAGTLETVFLADIGALKRHEDPVAADEGGAAEEEALYAC
jgi:hypothetical protein